MYIQIIMLIFFYIQLAMILSVTACRDVLSAFYINKKKNRKKMLKYINIKPHKIL